MFTVAGKVSGVGSTTLPCLSIYAPAGNGFTIREIALWNTSITACEFKIQRLTTAGTPGTGLTEVEQDEDGPAPTATAFGPHTVAPTLGDVIRYCPIGAAIGAGFYYTFGGKGLRVKPGTGNGIGVVLATGTGQVLGYHIDWEE